MKKYLFSCVMLVAAVMTAGCSKDDDVKHPSALDDEELYAIIMPNDSQFGSYSMSDVVFTLSQIEAYDPESGTLKAKVPTDGESTQFYPPATIYFYSHGNLLFSAQTNSSFSSMLVPGLQLQWWYTDDSGYSCLKFYNIQLRDQDLTVIEGEMTEQQRNGFARMEQILQKAGKYNSDITWDFPPIEYKYESPWYLSLHLPVEEVSKGMLPSWLGELMDTIRIYEANYTPDYVYSAYEGTYKGKTIYCVEAANYFTQASGLDESYISGTMRVCYTANGSPIEFTDDLKYESRDWKLIYHPVPFINTEQTSGEVLGEFDSKGNFVVTKINPPSNDEFLKIVSGYGWHEAVNHEITRDGHYQLREYWEGLVGGAPNTYEFQTDSVTTYMYLDWAPGDARLKQQMRYDETTGKVYFDGKEAFTVLSATENEIKIVKFAAIRGSDNAKIYLYIILSKLSDEQLQYYKDNYTSDYNAWELF